MVTEFHTFAARVSLPPSDTPYQLGEYVTLRLVFGLDDEEQLVVQGRVMAGSVEGPQFVGYAHIDADCAVEVLR